MRILHVNKFLYRRGGAEAYMEDTAALQRAAGHEVAFFATAHPDNIPSEFERFFPPYIELEPAPAGLAGRLSAASKMVWSRTAQTGMRATLEAFRPDVVHLHNIYHHLSPSVLQPCGQRSVATVMTLHDYKLACPTYQLLDHGRPCTACVGRNFRHAVLRRCKDDSRAASAAVALELSLHIRSGAYGGVGAFVCPSQFLLQIMTEARVFPDRLVFLPHFVSVAEVPIRDHVGDGVVFAGRLASEKGVDTLLRAAEILVGTQFHIAGDGPARADLEALGSHLDNVTFHGRLSRPATLELIRSARVAAVPSRWHENQPMAVLEAMSCGVPVVTTNLGGLPELVRHGIDGMLVTPDDPVDLATALGTVLNDPDRALAMGAAARRRIVADFTPERHLDGLAEIYALADRRARSVA